MRSAIAVAAVAAVLAGCGGGLDEDFGGRWSGPMTLRIQDVGEVSAQSTLMTEVGEKGLLVAGLCDDSSGWEVTAKPDGDRAKWAGSLTCADSFAVYECESVSFIYQTADFSLDGAALDVFAAGEAVGCGVAHNFNVSFRGGK